MSKEGTICALVDINEEASQKVLAKVHEYSPQSIYFNGDLFEVANLYHIKQ